jgi:hypothetical protein
MPEAQARNTQPVNSSVRRELTDANPRGIVLFGVVLIVTAIIAHVVVYGIYRGMAAADRQKQPALPPVAGELPTFPLDLHGKESRVPNPHLQVNEREDLEHLRQREQAQLDAAPAWVDRKQGIVRLPIEDVMRLLADPKAAAALGVRTRPEKAK